MGMFNRKPATEGKYYNGMEYGKATHKFGIYENAKFIYECRIKDSQNRKKGCVLVYANDFGEAKWCMMGFLNRPLVTVDTSEPYEKHFVMPDDMQGNMLDVTVIRMHNI